MNLHTQCIHCGSSNLKSLTKFQRVPLFRCTTCDLVFAQRIPSAEELNQYYANYGQHHYASPITRMRYREWLRGFEPYRHTRNILDIGCGVGFFGEEAMAAGWQVFGTEFSEGLVEICRKKNITMHKGPLDDQCFNGIQFDVIVWVEVIEHINHPHRDLAVINRLLRPGGLLFVTTPNFNSIERRWLGEKFNVIDWPEHLTYYTSKTLRRVLASEGFSKKKITTTGISFSRLKSSLGQHAAPTSAAASADESFRSAAERNFLLKYVKWQINVFLNLTRTGLSMKGWFEKKS